ncbi:TlpA family protein disulfide reductase [Streptomyces sp. NA04227]|uniref:TlpA family protein disulfide reductase n=1 Tax=Streptomyces sp. NA04227 TaxID=2742136 RepID=UPI00159239D1|nr:TlpA disulfide reductase family protein [Streptomyces sp. NA04227]QKW08428.1 TlpA family protein disulfide reductase [Streptomyces sp. NA04227]
MSAARRARRARRSVATAATARRTVLVTASAALALTACTSGGTSGGGGDTNFVMGKDGISTVKSGDRKDGPDIAGETLDGDKLALADMRGKVVVLNVWGSWCPPCRAEAPGFVRVATDLKPKGVEFVGINTRNSSTGPAKKFEKDYGVTYPSLYDPAGRLMLRFGKGTLNPQAIPSTLVLDREGRIAARSLRPLSEEKLRKMIDPVLAEK